MRRSLLCVFLTRYAHARDDETLRRREFVFAVKNCRTVKVGPWKGMDGREAAVRVSARRELLMRAYLQGATLVPVPPSGAGVDVSGDDLWPSRDLAEGLAQYYGLTAHALLQRRTPIEKSSLGHGPRNLRRQVESLALAGPLPSGPIVLVDDFVASGSTMCGCAALLHAAAPSHAAPEIKGFAVAYSPGDTDELLGGTPGSSQRLAGDFAARQYEWDGLDERPRNWLVESPLREH
jgi:hypothetical protein